MKKTLLILLIVSIVAIGLVGYFVISNSNQNKPQQTSEQESQSESISEQTSEQESQSESISEQTSEQESESISEQESESVHTHSYTAVVTPPTCTKQGYTTHTCSCGDSYVDTYTKAKGHNYTTKVIAPTCTAQGYTLHTCSACYDSYKDTYINAKGHNYTTKVIAPTCTNQGYTLHTCSVCRDSYKDTYVQATGHSYSTVWSNDETHHWHASTCGHDSEISGKAEHTFSGNICTTCGYTIPTPPTSSIYTRIDGSGNASETGEYILFGSYPQTDVTSSMGDTLSSYVTSKPSNGNNNGWTSYKYYFGTDDEGSQSNSTDYMWYKDVTYNSNKYRAVYFTSYRSSVTHYSSSTYNSEQDDNGYYTSNVYWFKFEPIKWRILEEKEGKATLLAEMIIDSQDYNYTWDSKTIDDKTVYGNNYEYSSIRAWLNDNFYNTAFNSSEQEILNVVTVDNSARSTNPDNNATYYNSGVNDYACNNTQDKVWLLSEQEVTKSEYGFDTDTGETTTRQKQSTSYADCQGVYHYVFDHTSLAYWWVRSPYCDFDIYARRVNYNGENDYCGVVCVNFGVVPAIQISL